VPPLLVIEKMVPIGKNGADWNDKIANQKTT
jgi:hypothetical protein